VRHYGHANFAAVVVLGLRCEVNQIGRLVEEQKLAGRLRDRHPGGRRHPQDGRGRHRLRGRDAFTKGRGIVFGFNTVPTIKLATNTPMYGRMEGDMDINCGTILDGEETVEQCDQRMFDPMLRTASGQPTKSESFDFDATAARNSWRRCLKLNGPTQISDVPIEFLIHRKHRVARLLRAQVTFVPAKANTIASDNCPRRNGFVRSFVLVRKSSGTSEGSAKPDIKRMGRSGHLRRA
jgi:D-galactarate/Altronate dehydratase, C-terminal